MNPEKGGGGRTCSEAHKVLAHVYCHDSVLLCMYCIIALLLLQSCLTLVVIVMTKGVGREGASRKHRSCLRRACALSSNALPCAAPTYGYFRTYDSRVVIPSKQQVGVLDKWSPLTNPLKSRISQSYGMYIILQDLNFRKALEQHK